MPFTSHTVSLPTGPVTYWTAGEGRPLLHLHAAGGIDISRPLEVLAETRQVFLPIFPGFDGTPYHEALPQSMEALADLTAAFHDALIGAPCDVMSSSYGGWVSLWLAVKYPGKVEQLVLGCPAGFQIDGSGFPDMANIIRLMFAHPEKIRPSAKTPAQREASFKARPHYQKGFVAEDLIPRLGEIQARALILVGTLDHTLPKEGMQLLKSRLPHAHLHYLYDAAHVIESDQPERFLKLVSSFLDRGDAYIVNFGAEAAAAS